jgi:hypothetical protein
MKNEPEVSLLPQAPLAGAPPLLLYAVGAPRRLRHEA